MLRLTRTAIGLLTAQYRSVLKKCWAINVGVFGLMGKAVASVAKGAADTIGGTLNGYGINVMAYMLGLLDSLLNIKSNAFDAQSAKATATELPFGAPTVAGTFSFFDAENENVTDGLFAKRVFKTKLITSTAIGLMVATMAMPSDAYAGSTGGNGNTASGVYSSAFGDNNTANGFQSSAFGYANTASGHYSSAFGRANTASGESSSAFGSWNTARGQQSSAFGYQNSASGVYSSAFGYKNTAYGVGSSAFGFNAQAGNPSDDTINSTTKETTSSEERFATAVGSYVQATGKYALALGNQKEGMTQTTASGESAIAIGTGAQATHDNSVAIGTNSVSAGENTISVGSSTTQRQIKYVAAGTDDTDAVNLKQLNDALDAIAGAGSGSNYSAGTGLSLSGTTFSAKAGNSTITVDSDGIKVGTITSANIALATGDSNGQVKIGGANVSVKGLADAAYRGVDTSIADGSTSTNLATSQAIASFVEGKGYLTSSSLSEYATKDWVGEQGYLTSHQSLSNYYTKSDVYTKNEIDDIQSLNNYYRKNKKSGILNGFEEGEKGNENDDNFVLKNDNFVAKNDNFVAKNDSFLTNNGDFASKNPSHFGAFSKCEKACSRPSERFPASMEKNSAFEQYSRSARGTFLFGFQPNKNVLDNFSKLTANENFAIVTTSKVA